ncbi:aldo-keto reductase family protein [Jatrophihabitans lederbergiae]|uniref:Uncharacterized protein n=1 Tax=Jatrophihabitans lederbergiae TaxID=3075547 RepID=A0ABU2JFD7_9ACTN|nr:hypothetical protein [Jatrophihabitans sp. DSM 44399]MDT0263714.1 hypothetical protein [Jatrophihabitans sp. DSM 44399]
MHPDVGATGLSQGSVDTILRAHTVHRSATLRSSNRWSAAESRRRSRPTCRELRTGVVAADDALSCGLLSSGWAAAPAGDECRRTACGSKGT